jgi:CheY-like chemotaxis protein
MTAKTVLLVEDDLELRDILQDILEADGYDVVPAYNGRQALQYLLLSGEPAPHVMVLDLMMPMVNGWQVLDAIRGEVALQRLPVIVISASNRGRPDGATTYLQKPFSLAQLLESIHQQF